MPIRRTATAALILLVAGCVGLTDAASARQSAAPVDLFERQVLDAVASNDQELLDLLLLSDRLAFKPLVADLVAQSIHYSISGDERQADAVEVHARQIAERFEEVHGERSLLTSVDYLSAWDTSAMRLKLEADSLYALGTDLRGSSSTRDQALAAYERAETLYRQIGDRIGEATAAGGLGYLSWFMHRDQYLEQNQHALALRREVNDLQLVGNSLNDVGLAYRAVVGDNGKALEHYLESERVRISIGDSLALARLLPNIGRTYVLDGQLEKSIPYYNRGAEIAGRVGDASRQAVALRNAGAVSSDLGRLNDALDYFTLALNVREAAGMPTIDILNHLGITYRRLGDFESALTYYQRVVALATEAEDTETLAGALSNIGVVYLYAERPDRAIRYFERARKQSEALEDQQGVLNAIINLASGHFETGDYESAEPFAEEAIQLARELQDELNEATALIVAGNVNTRLDRYEEAERAYEAGLRLSLSLAVPDKIFAAVLGLGELNERRGDYDAAISNYERAFDVLESTRGSLETDEDKAGFLAQQRYAYEEYIHMLTKLHRLDPDEDYHERAFRFAERGKARAFLDLLSEALADVQSGVDPALLQRQDSLLQDIAALRNEVVRASSPATGSDSLKADVEARLAESQKNYAVLERQLRAENPRYAELQYPRPSGIGEVQQNVLDDEVALLQYSVGDSSSSMWIITTESAELVSLPNREALREQVELIRFALTDPAKQEVDLFARSALRLYEMLVAPAADVLARKSKLVVVTDDVLSYLPFEALISRAADAGARFSDLHYLVSTHAISYAQSASVLGQLVSDRTARAASKSRGLLAFGDPVFASEIESDSRGGPSELQRLPYSGAEVRSIAEFFDEGDADVFLREDATEDQLKAVESMGSYRYLHLATHGLVDDRRPDFSAVVLSADDDPAEDGMLQAAEIFNLTINADLVVLSACETGLGRMVRGEGLVGLTRAFMYAGAPSVAVSLWAVADESTSTLMQHFYGNVVEASTDKSDALRAAKVAMIRSEEYAHPFHWAPFVLSGDWR